MSLLWSVITAVLRPVTAIVKRRELPKLIYHTHAARRRSSGGFGGSYFVPSFSLCHLSRPLYVSRLHCSQPVSGVWPHFKTEGENVQTGTFSHTLMIVLSPGLCVRLYIFHEGKENVIKNNPFVPFLSRFEDFFINLKQRLPLKIFFTRSFTDIISFCCGNVNC